MSALKQAFVEARRQGSLLAVFEPLIAAKLFVVGAIGPDGKPNIALKRAGLRSNLCATVSERREWLEGVPAAQVLPINGEVLVSLLGPHHDMMIVYDDGAEIIDHEWLIDFREALAG